MKHSNVSIFIPHGGCRHSCSFCNQVAISSVQKPPTVEQVRKILQDATEQMKDKTNAEIAYFGGSFTALTEEYMVSLLEVAQPYIGDGKFKGIRISTRPDCISYEILDILKQYRVTSIELGAQSMVDEVLIHNRRGHSAKDVEQSVALIREYDFELGLQMMIGLYKSTREYDMQTAKECISLKPDTMRVYPTVVLKGTLLERYYNEGIYPIMNLDDAVELTTDILQMFKEEGIRVIKVGLHSSEQVQEDMVAGIYHQAFMELCSGLMYYKKISTELKSKPKGDYQVEVSPKEISKVIGQSKVNINKFAELGYGIKIVANELVMADEYLIKKHK